jgi:DNA-binding MarR family transcriptional regulator
MGDLVTQCEAWGIVQRASDPTDARARLVCFTEAGLQWLKAFEDAVQQAEAEFEQEVGTDVARVVAFGLEGYSRSYADVR